MNTAPLQDGTYRALILLGIAAFIAWLPLTLGALLWLPAVALDGEWSAATIAALFIIMPIVQLAVLRRASDLQRRNRIRQARALIACQVLVAGIVALWIVL